MDERPMPDPADDDAYRALFRDEPVASATPLPAAAPEPAAVPEPIPEPTPEATPQQPAGAASDTGRLFRSSRAEASAPAIIAIAPDRAARLRTLQVDEAQQPAPAAPLLISSQSPRELPEVAPPVEAAGPSRRRLRSGPRRPGPGLNWMGIAIIVGGATLVLGALDIVVGGPGLGLLTGLGLIAASGFAAWLARPADAPVAVVTPSLAFFVAAITLGQVGQPANGLLDRVVNVFFMLGSNWVWIIGATLVALAISLVRARQSR